LKGRRLVGHSDNAKYHHARLHAIWREERIPTFELDFLPAYSPELNPIERVRKLTRRLCLHNRYFGSSRASSRPSSTSSANGRMGMKPSAPMRNYLKPLFMVELELARNVGVEYIAAQSSPFKNPSRSTGASQLDRSSIRSFMHPSRTCRRPRGEAEIWATGLRCRVTIPFSPTFDLSG